MPRVDPVEHVLTRLWYSTNKATQPPQTAAQSKLAAVNRVLRCGKTSSPSRYTTGVCVAHPLTYPSGRCVAPASRVCDKEPVTASSSSKILRLSTRPLLAYRLRIAPTKSSQLVMLNGLMSSLDRFASGANYMGQRPRRRAHFRCGNAVYHPDCRAAGYSSARSGGACERRPSPPLLIRVGRSRDAETETRDAGLL